jgi:hypothetical protein
MAAPARRWCLGRLGVELGLGERLPAEDRHQLMRGGAVVGRDGRAGLATLAPEPVAQALDGVRPLVLGLEEGQRAGRRGGQDLLELGQYRDHQVDRLGVAILVLAEGEPATWIWRMAGADVLGFEDMRRAELFCELCAHRDGFGARAFCYR